MHFSITFFLLLYFYFYLPSFCSSVQVYTKNQGISSAATATAAVNV